MGRRRNNPYKDFHHEEIVKIGSKYHLLYNFGHYMTEQTALRGINRWKGTKSFFPAVIIKHPHRFKKKFMVYGGLGLGKPMTKAAYDKMLQTIPTLAKHSWFVVHPDHIKYIVKK